MVTDNSPIFPFHLEDVEETGRTRILNDFISDAQQTPSKKE